MNRLKSVLGYGWAVLAIFIVLATFMANGYFSRELASATGVTVSPWYSGGEVTKTNEHGTYRTLIHRPVFDGLLWERTVGFVQVNWEPSEGLPSVIEEKINFNGDKEADFLIRLDTRTGRAVLTPYSTSVLSIDQVYKLSKGWAVRILLRKLD
jgi:hypothetical protein